VQLLWPARITNLWGLLYCCRDALLDALREEGHAASRSHVERRAIKTSASVAQVVRAARERLGVAARISAGGKKAGGSKGSSSAGSSDSSVKFSGGGGVSL
jgi:hypothetical protein